MNQINPSLAALISDARKMVREAQENATRSEAELRKNPSENNEYFARVDANHLAKCTELFNRIITKYC